MQFHLMQFFAQSDNEGIRTVFLLCAPSYEASDLIQF